MPQILTIQNIAEFVAVVSSLLYVFFAIKQNNMCWFASIASCIIYCYLCIDVKLYLESILQLFYLVMSIYGWVYWKKSDSLDLVVRDSVSKIIFISITLFMLSFVIGYFVKLNTNAALPYIDSCIFIFSIYATQLTATKKIESWLFWILIDFISIFIYLNRGLKLTAILYLLFTILAMKGFFEWRKFLKSQPI